MTQEDNMRMAREAGFVEYELEDYTQSGYDIRYERFAALVRADEREECCSIVWGLCESDNVAQRTVDAIRARGQA